MVEQLHHFRNRIGVYAIDDVRARGNRTRGSFGMVSVDADLEGLETRDGRRKGGAHAASHVLRAVCIRLRTVSQGDGTRGDDALCQFQHRHEGGV